MCSVVIARPSIRCLLFVWLHQDRLRRAETARDGASADLAASAAKAEDLDTQLASAEEGLRHAEQALMDAQDRVQHYKVTCCSCCRDAAVKFSQSGGYRHSAICLHMNCVVRMFTTSTCIQRGRHCTHPQFLWSVGWPLLAFAHAERDCIPGPSAV